MNFQTDLKKFGLSDKEAAVYLAVLGQGQATVLQISRKSKVARATTYLVLESLMDLGLVSRTEEDGKVFFVAERPDQLGVLLDKKEQEISRERAGLDDLLPKLRAFMKTAGDQPTARYYSGVEGLKVIRSEMLMYSQPGDTWYQLAPIDYMRNVFPDSGDLTYVQQRKAKRIQSKAIVSTSSPELHKMLEDSAQKKWAERKFVDPKHYTSPSGFSLYGDRISISDYGGTIGGVTIESEAMVTMMREMFLLLWRCL